MHIGVGRLLSASNIFQYILDGKVLISYLYGHE